MLSSFFSNTHMLVLFHWLLYHSSIFDSFPLTKNLRPQEIFFCSQSSQVLYSYFSSASPLCNPLSAGFFYVYWAPLCFLLSTCSYLPGRQLPPSFAGTNRLISLKFPKHVHWGPQSTDTTPKWGPYLFCGLALPSWIPTQSCCARMWYRVSWRTQFSPFPIPLGHRQYSMKSWARKKSHIIQIIHKSPSPLWWPMDWISFTRSNVSSWLFCWGGGWVFSWEAHQAFMQLHFCPTRSPSMSLRVR